MVYQQLGAARLLIYQKWRGEEPVRNINRVTTADAWQRRAGHNNEGVDLNKPNYWVNRYDNIEPQLETRDFLAKFAG